MVASRELMKVRVQMPAGYDEEEERGEMRLVVWRRDGRWEVRAY